MVRNNRKLFIYVGILIIVSCVFYLYKNKVEKFSNNFSHLIVHHHPGKKKRLGANGDGGYVFADNYDYDCYISAGVNDEESFSRDFINYYKMPKEHNYAFDGTIEDYPYHYTKDIQFVKKNIGTENTDKTTNLKYLIDKYNDIFLKMDIEGWEISWLNSLDDSDLRKFKQIVLEIHGIHDDTFDHSHADKIKLCNKLNKTHYLIHIHGNNYGGTRTIDGVEFPNTIEATYVRKDLYNEPLKPNTLKLPIDGLDMTNNGSADIDLSFYPFKQ
jgi:hypothetical protein